MGTGVNGHAERILVLAPTGKDGPLTCRMLREAGLSAVPCADMPDLCRHLGEGAGAVFVTDEALDPAATRALVAALHGQPSWSDVPVVVATTRAAPQSRLRALRMLEPLWNVTFLERPVRVMTLVSTLRMTLRARRRQYEVRELLGQLEQGVRQRDEFLATLAHELRNPLAPIRSAVELMHQQGALDPLVERVRDVVDRQSRQLTRLVDDLLEVSRITRGKITLREEPVELAAVVEHAVEAVQPLIDARRQRLTVTAAGEALWVRGDLTRLAQVVTNLLNNAAKYTPEGGAVFLSWQREGAEAVLRVRDTGAGISPELLPHVFDPFIQGHRVHDRLQGGLGLGLAVVRKLVEMHGGTVSAFSAGAGRGAEFVVRLPLLTDGVGRTEKAPESGARPDARRRRILVVDDNVDAAESLGQLLSLSGHETRVVHDGPAALTAAAEFRPDVVLLDIGLPGMDGYEVARRLREQPETRDVFLIALTGFGQEQDRQRTREGGFDAHCVKPLDFEALQTLLAGHPKP